MAEIKRPRRYYLLQRQQCLRDGDIALAGTWRWKQERQPGTTLPATFYLRARLAEHGYTTIEDLDGADLAEIEDVACLSTREAARVLEELAELLEQPTPPENTWASLTGAIFTTLSGDPYTHG